MVKKFPNRIFLTSLVITVIVFVAGLLLGYNLDILRTTSILDELKGNELDTESYLVEQAFWESFGGDDCSFAQPRLTSISGQLGELGNILNSYEEKSIFEADEFAYLARRYFLLEINAYILEMDLKEECGLDNTVILYFYGTEDTASETQGFILDKLVGRGEGTVDVYSINQEFEGEPAIDTLVLYYNITDVPTLIINGETRKEGLTSYAELLALIEE